MISSSAFRRHCRPNIHAVMDISVLFTSRFISAVDARTIQISFGFSSLMSASNSGRTGGFCEHQAIPVIRVPPCRFVGACRSGIRCSECVEHEAPREVSPMRQSFKRKSPSHSPSSRPRIARSRGVRRPMSSSVLWESNSSKFPLWISIAPATSGFLIRPRLASQCPRSPDRAQSRRAGE